MTKKQYAQDYKDIYGKKPSKKELEKFISDNPPPNRSLDGWAKIILRSRK